MTDAKRPAPQRGDRALDSRFDAAKLDEHVWEDKHADLARARREGARAKFVWLTTLNRHPHCTHFVFRVAYAITYETESITGAASVAYRQLCGVVGGAGLTDQGELRQPTRNGVQGAIRWLLAHKFLIVAKPGIGRGRGRGDAPIYELTLGELRWPFAP